MEEDSSRILRVGRIQYDQLTPQELHLCSICLELICVTDELSPGDKEGEDEEGDDIDTEENDMSAHTCEQREFPHIFHTVCLRQACISVSRLSTDHATWDTIGF